MNRFIVKNYTLLTNMTTSPYRFFGHSPDKVGYCFSNFSDHPTVIDGITWPTTEHYFQAAKFFNTAPKYATKIQLAETPRLSKTLGNSRDYPIDPNWEQIKDDVMRKAVKAKVEQHPDVKQTLLATGNREMIEASPYDYYWGEGRDKTGKNMLGKILVEVRDYYNHKIEII
jgi:ribA/ribD-fused uncharacterized protein